MSLPEELLRWPHASPQWQWFEAQRQKEVDDFMREQALQFEPNSYNIDAESVVHKNKTVLDGLVKILRNLPDDTALNVHGIQACKGEPILARERSKTTVKRLRAMGCNRHLTSSAEVGSKIATEFKLLPSYSLKRGSFVELAFSSASPDEHVARQYAASGGVCDCASQRSTMWDEDTGFCRQHMSTLFEIETGQIDRGATLKW